MRRRRLWFWHHTQMGNACLYLLGNWCGYRCGAGFVCTLPRGTSFLRFESLQLFLPTPPLPLVMSLVHLFSDP
ncbi:hypothetical protein D3C85_760990 [compost metagenome]